MSGIVGLYIKKPLDHAMYNERLDEALLMAENLVNPYSEAANIVYKDQNLILSCVQRPSFDVSNPVVSQFQEDNTLTLVDGRVYLAADKEFLGNCAQYFYSKYGDTLTKKCELTEDGEYIVVAYDKSLKSLTLASDFLGHRALYIYENEEVVYFSSEVKAFLFIESFPAEIRAKSIVNFFEYGVLPENDTWFNNVRMIGPGETLAFIGESNWEFTRNIFFDTEKLNNNVSFNEALKHTRYLFDNAIKKRLPPKDKSKVAVKLSGGLDSRAVLASLYSLREDITAFTFGKKESYDFRIASAVTKKLSVKHIKTEMNEANWFDGRVKAVWDMDGQLDMRHMHGVVDMHKYSKHDIHFSGVLGGAIIGGFLREKWPAMDPLDVIRYRLRRFSGSSMSYSANFIEERMPFYDRELNHYLLSLPNEYLARSRLYNKLLIVGFPLVFRMIPWQHTMLPLWFNPKLHTYSQKLMSIISNLQMRKSKTYLEWRFSNEELWARQEPVKAKIDDYLLSTSPLYADYIDKILTQNKVKSYLKGNNSLINFVLRLLTIEIWLLSVKRKGPLN
jgi:asparagine synthetase B (glutamine-hydrolysing)